MNHLDILVLVDGFIKDNGYPPTRTEIAIMMGSGSPNASQYHLLNLEKKGLINVKRNISRGLVVTAKGKKALAESRKNRNAN